MAGVPAVPLVVNCSTFRSASDGFVRVPPAATVSAPGRVARYALATTTRSRSAATPITAPRWRAITPAMSCASDELAGAGGATLVAVGLGEGAATISDDRAV